MFLELLIELAGSFPTLVFPAHLSTNRSLMRSVHAFDAARQGGPDIAQKGRTYFPQCKVDEVIEDGDEITDGTTTFHVVHLPGHTPGCTGYLWDAKLIRGDVVFPGGSLGWNDVHWGSNYLDVIDTMNRIAELSPARANVS